MSIVEKLRERFRRRNPMEEFITAVSRTGNLPIDIGVEEIKGMPRCQREIGSRVVAISGENRLVLGEEWYPGACHLLKWILLLVK